METIFIQVVAYRDRELVPTIQDAIAQATHPERLRFGICWQYESEEEKHYINPLKTLKNCRIQAISSQKSRGVGWARSQVQKLWCKEKYTLQIDSHMRFAEGWDKQVIEMLNLCPSQKPLLTAYVAGYEPPRNLMDDIPTRLESEKFYESGVLTLKPTGNLSQYSTPQPGAFVSGHFIFADASIIEEVPYDPDIYFTGEEVLLAARAWTRGWDIYYPHKTLCWHYYNSGNKRPLHWQDHQKWWTQNQVSEQRFRQIMGMESSSKQFGVYGLGKTRTLAEYEEVAGVKFQQRSKESAPQSGSLRDRKLLLLCAKPALDSTKTEKIKKIIWEGVNWDYLLRTASQQRVMPLLYWNLKNTCPEAVPETTFTQLEQDFHTNAVHNLLLTKELHNILNLFQDHNITAIPFKGPVLATSVYGNLSMRQFGDLDIILRKQDMVNAQKLLLSQGYVLQRKQNHLTPTNQNIYLDSQHRYDEWYWKTLDNNSLFGARVEIHWETTAKHIINPLNLETVWQHLETISISGMTFPSLPPEVLLPILCINYAKDHWTQLKMVSDIAQLIDTYKDLDWAKVMDYANNLGRQRNLFLGLLLAHELLDSNIPQTICQKIDTDTVAKSLAKQVRQRLFDNYGSHPGIVENTMFNLRLREHLQDKIRYIFFSTTKVLETRLTFKYLSAINKVSLT
ncbi:MAG: GlcNAc-transferase family protein [Crocosphaera sp.]